MEKQEKIVSMFNDIAGTYDIANRVLSMGIDKSWRNKACNKTFELYGKKTIEKIVDVACGTGDMILFWKKVAAENNIDLQNIIGVDPSVGMMEVGKRNFLMLSLLKQELHLCHLRIQVLILSLFLMVLEM